MRLWSKAQHHPSQWTEGLGGEKGAERVEKGVEGCEGAEVARREVIALCPIRDGSCTRVGGAAFGFGLGFGFGLEFQSARVRLWFGWLP